MSLLIRTFGWVFVLMGLAAPAGVGYLYYSRPDQVKTYISSYEDFASLPEEERKQVLENLELSVKGWGAVKDHVAQDFLIREILETNLNAKGGE